MEKLHELELDFEQAGLSLEIVGLDSHRQFSEHPHAARRRGLSRIRRVTVVADSGLEEQLTNKFAEFGVSGYTCIPCSGAGRRVLADRGLSRNSQVRIEVVAPDDIAEKILGFIQDEVSPQSPVTACLETVEVLRRDKF
jgi:hypothetical protein